MKQISLFAEENRLHKLTSLEISLRAEGNRLEGVTKHITVTKIM